MTSPRKAGILAGAFFLLAAAAAIAALPLYHDVLHDPRYVLDSGRSDTGVLLGAVLEFVAAVSVVGTATALWPVVRRESEGLALAYVVGRLIEAALIVVGIMSLLSIATLRQDAAGPDASLVATGRALVALHAWTFLFGPGLAIGINTTVLATLMYRSQLVPRAIARIGLIGGPLVFSSSMAVLFGAYDQVSAVAGLAAAPVFVWEMSLAAWMIARGLNTSPAPVQPAREIRATAVAC
jgi:hypothetical protein